jgi:hypothetical protein
MLALYRFPSLAPQPHTECLRRPGREVLYALGAVVLLFALSQLTDIWFARWKKIPGTGRLVWFFQLPIVYTIYGVDRHPLGRCDRGGAVHGGTYSGLQGSDCRAVIAGWDRDGRGSRRHQRRRPFRDVEEPGQLSFSSSIGS